MCTSCLKLSQFGITGDSIPDEVTQVELIVSFVTDPGTSLRRVTRQLVVSHETVWKASSVNKFQPYEIQFLHQLHEDNNRVLLDNHYTT